MSLDRKSFIKVDELMPQVCLEQAAVFYGVTLPELHRIGKETRSRCFLNCGRTAETGDRVLAIQEGHPAKQWHCHNYGCNKGGNLLSLIDLLKPGTCAGGRPRGQRFKEIASDLQAMASGESPPPLAEPTAAPPRSTIAQEPASPKLNVPLAQSENERARALTELDQKFVRDPTKMTPKASGYFRRRPFLTPENCEKWRMGYLPRDSGGDRSGGTMRGKIVYAFRSESGEVLAWFGRDPEYEEKWSAWQARGQDEREPEKFHFVKGFHRGIELFGQDALRGEAAEKQLRELGLFVVEGPNDVIRLDALGVPAVAVCSNAITREQAEKAAKIAREIGNGTVTLLFDCDPEGESGMKQALGYLAQLVPVRCGWTGRMFGEKFKGRQPESLNKDEWAEIERFLRSGVSEGWSLA